jgi:hypothetical protein
MASAVARVMTPMLGLGSRVIPSPEAFLPLQHYFAKFMNNGERGKRPGAFGETLGASPDRSWWRV